MTTKKSLQPIQIDDGKLFQILYFSVLIFFFRFLFKIYPSHLQLVEWISDRKSIVNIFYDFNA